MNDRVRCWTVTVTTVAFVLVTAALATASAGCAYFDGGPVAFDVQVGVRAVGGITRDTPAGATGPVEIPAVAPAVIPAPQPSERGDRWPVDGSTSPGGGDRASVGGPVTRPPGGD